MGVKIATRRSAAGFRALPLRPIQSKPNRPRYQHFPLFMHTHTHVRPSSFVTNRVRICRAFFLSLGCPFLPTFALTVPHETPTQTLPNFINAITFYIQRPSSNLFRRRCYACCIFFSAGVHVRVLVGAVPPRDTRMRAACSLHDAGGPVRRGYPVGGVPAPSPDSSLAGAERGDGVAGDGGVRVSCVFLFLCLIFRRRRWPVVSWRWRRQ